MALLSVTINGKEMFSTFGLILKHYNISEATPQTKRVQVPGRSGSLDLTKYLTGEVPYNERKIEMEFLYYGTQNNYASVCTAVQSDFHGQDVQIIFGDNDDPNHMWKGTAEVEHSNFNRVATIKIVATVDPFKYDATEQAFNWLTQTVDFDGTLSDSGNLIVTSSQLVKVNVTTKRMIPTITLLTASQMTVEYDGESFLLYNGDNTLPELYFKEGICPFTIRGNGYVKMTYRGGVL